MIANKKGVSTSGGQPNAIPLSAHRIQVTKAAPKCKNIVKNPAVKMNTIIFFNTSIIQLYHFKPSFQEMGYEHPWWKTLSGMEVSYI